MKTHIKYIASSGNEYDLTTNGITHSNANYYEWEWNAEEIQLQFGTRVSDFSREAAVYEAELVFKDAPMDMRRKIRALHNDFENDLRNKTPGRIVWGDYYIDCFIMRSVTKPADVWWKNLTNTIRIYAPYPFWVKEEKIVLPMSEVRTGSFLDYTFDYTYDYAAPVVGTKNIKSEFPFDSEFQMIIYGPAVNPRITINKYPYVLYTTIPQGAYTIIDSRSKSIMQYMANVKTNMFNYRNKTNSIFQKVPGGNLVIEWDATFGADIILYREQSEPEFEEVV